MHHLVPQWVRVGLKGGVCHRKGGWRGWGSGELDGAGERLDSSDDFGAVYAGR